MDLAGFGERLFFRVLASLKLTVISKTLKSIDGQAPNQIVCYSAMLLLYWMRRKF